MLLEHINHYKNLHFSIEFSNVAQEAPHYHKEMELTLVLRGHARYRVHHQEFFIKAGDILTIDTQDLHYIAESSEDVVMLTLHVDVAFFSDQYPNIDVMFFACDDLDGQSSARHQWQRNNIEFLSRQIAEMMALCQNNNDNLQQLQYKLQEFVYLLVDRFQSFFIEGNEFHPGSDDASPVDLERLYRIMHHMYTNYEKKITLKDLSEMEHLSIHYISHLIKKTSGLSFQNLLNYIRVESAEKLLNENKLTLTQISEACGFSSPSYFNKCFREWHGITPAKYRKQPRPEKRSFHDAIDNEEALALLQPYLNSDPSRMQHQNSGFSSNHISIPVKLCYPGGKDIRKAFPLHIMIDTPEALGRVPYYKSELLALAPASIATSETIVAHHPDGAQILHELSRCGLFITIRQDVPALLSVPALNAADAFESIKKKPELPVRLFGTSCALFTKEGLPTPYYSLYHALADTEGVIGEQKPQYTLFSKEGCVTIFICRASDTSPLNVRLCSSDFNFPRCVLRKTLTSDCNAYPILDALGSQFQPDNMLKKQLYHLAKGSTEILMANSLSHNADGVSGSRFTLTVEPRTLVALTLL